MKTTERYYVVIETVNVLTQGGNVQHDSVILIDPDSQIARDCLNRYKRQVIFNMDNPAFIEFNQYESSFSFRYVYSQEVVFHFKFKVDTWSKAQFDALQFFSPGGIARDAHKT